MDWPENLTLYMLGNFVYHTLSSSDLKKKSIYFLKKYFRNTLRVSNSLDPDNAQHVAKCKLLAKDVSRCHQQTKS